MMSTNNFFDRDVLNPFQKAQEDTREKVTKLYMPAVLKILHKDSRIEEIPCLQVMTIGRDKSSTVHLHDPLVQETMELLSCWQRAILSTRYRF